ncbi:MAG TPA: 50S ribosomal protein L25/general stress protein Ctc [Gammaproteobacteria bacterium]|nr:50S ribosomal protein L25/general stress protein Ctc [Gammaproteobacteria bacterium]
MSKTDFTLNVEVRTDAGKGASRRLRRANKVPGIVYGGHKDPVAITIDHAELQNKLQNEGFYSAILKLKVGKEESQVILKDLQRHPYKPIIMHADFMRVSANEEIRVSVPLHFLNEASSIGVKQQGGMVFRVMTQLEVFCLPKDLPQFIEVDVANLEVGQSLHISDIKLPEGVRSADLAQGPEHDQAVVTIQAARVSEEAAEGEEEGGGEAAGE